MTWWTGKIAVLICLLMSAATALALVETNEWWIRILDFPRLQIAVALIVAMFVYWWTRPRGAEAAIVTVVSISALAWQVAMIMPYTPIWKYQMVDAIACSDDQQVSFLVANVLQENRRSEGLLQLVDDSDPDVILLTEIDAWWAREVDALKTSYPQTILEPRSNHYGIGLYSRLPLINGQVRFILDDDIPSVLTRIVLPNGTEFSLWGVHPPPPRPGDDTEERDAELLIVAKEAADAAGPVIVAGDLNDVAWSSTTTLFQDISGLLDPRVGRGLYPSFNANWPLMKWPLDHLFASEEWTLSEFRRLGHIGSDHFPIFVELCLQPQAAALQDGNQPEPEDLEEAEEHIEEGREAVGQ